MSRTVPLRSMPLRDLLNALEHRVRELHEHLNMDLMTASDEVHQLTRPKRRKSSYPTIRNISNGCERYFHALRYADKMLEEIDEGLMLMEERLTEVV
jgi:hypothetical protein